MQKKNKKIVVGLTGGIASGKSLVLSQFKKMGFRVLDADFIARSVIQPDQIAYPQIVEKFGKDIIDSNSRINREILGKIIFGSLKKKKELEKIIHPIIFNQIKTELKRIKSGVVVVDIPLLFESKMNSLMDYVVVVWVDLATQKQRLIERNQYTLKEAIQRIQAQWPLSRKIKLADFVIDNSKSRNETRKQVKKISLNLTRILK